VFDFFFGFWDDFGASVQGREGGDPFYGWAGTERCRAYVGVVAIGIGNFGAESQLPLMIKNQKTFRCGQDLPPQITRNEIDPVVLFGFEFYISTYYSWIWT
jgi:hypothetical protein